MHCQQTNQSPATIFLARIGEGLHINGIPDSGKSFIQLKDHLILIFYIYSPICHQNFKRRRSLYEHMSTHGYQKPYPCTYTNCTKSFSESFMMVRHLRTHTGELPHECSFCPKKFITYSNMQDHMMSHDISRKGKFKCLHQGCKKAYTHKRTLRKHEKVKHGDKKIDYKHKSKF